MTEHLSQFSKNLKFIRKRRNLTQAQLAEKIGVSKQSINNYENGVNFPKGKQLNALMDVLEVTPEQLLSDFLQLEEEKDMITAFHRNAIINMRLYMYENTFTYEDEREILLNHFNKMNNKDLRDALYAFYEKKSELAQSTYLKAILNEYLNNPDAFPNLDIQLYEDEE